MPRYPIPDVYDVARCPLGHRCESCGVEDPALRVVPVDMPGLGVACLTLCRGCNCDDVAPPVTVGTAVRLVGQHAAHLGITVDDMAEALRAEGHES
jgi:hypothetical protein